MATTYDPKRLRELGTRYRKALAAIDAVRDELDEQVTAAILQGVPHAEIVSLSGRSADRVRLAARAAGTPGVPGRRPRATNKQSGSVILDEERTG